MEVTCLGKNEFYTHTHTYIYIYIYIYINKGESNTIQKRSQSCKKSQGPSQN